MKRYKIKPYKSYRRKSGNKKTVFFSIVLILITLILLVRRYTDINLISWKTPYQSKAETNVIKKGLMPLTGYIPSPGPDYLLYREPVEVKGIYVSGRRAGSSQIDELISLCNRTEINAMVIDVKSDDGYLTFSMDHPIIKEAGAIPDKVAIADIKDLMTKLYENNIYPIARIVTFKDNIIAKTHPEYMLKNKDGTLYQSNEPGGKKATWLNPYNQEVWEYILTIAKEAARVGFREIQFDYVRFHEGTNKEKVDFGPESETKDKIQVIGDFTKYAVKSLHEEGVYVSADVFGAIITSKIDAQIVGQDYTLLSKHLDYIYPMVYPSHYAEGSFGVAYPDLDPYQIILRSMEVSSDRLKDIPSSEHKAVVRPWLQDFTASWIPVHQAYGPEQIRQQIQGAYDAGLSGWILWSASSRYTEGGLLDK